MTSEAWRQYAIGLRDRLSRIDRNDGDHCLRSALVAAWHVLDIAPDAIAAEFGNISDARLISDSDAIDIRSAAPDFGLPRLQESDNPELVLWIAAAVRAFDRSLAEINDGSAPANPNTDWRVSLDGNSFFALPIPRGRWKKGAEPEKTFGPFSLRGLVRHRIVPTQVGGFDVVLHWSDALHDPDMETAINRFAGVLFQGIAFDLNYLDEPRSFLVSSVQAANLEDTCRTGVRNAFAEQCHVLVFPELTIDDETLAIIRDQIIERPWFDPSRPDTAFVAPAITLAGSWHRIGSRAQEALQRRFNEAVVLDSYGQELLRYRKRDIFRDPDGRIEAVERGSQHDLLITSSGIFTFGICLDFCNLVGRSPYERLDVDFVLVASCGNDATMGGHIDRSRSLLINRRTRVFIVQQSDTDRQDDMIGYILNPTGSAKSIVLSETLTGEPWNIYEAQAFIED